MNNLFEIDNARDLNVQELVDTFIPTRFFNQLLASKNQIVIGSRGSGKTALLKMLSHNHLSKLKDDIAKNLINQKRIIGIFISTKTKFIGGLKNKDWQNEKEQEFFFQWLMNIASCYALLNTLKSCLQVYCNTENARMTKELRICRGISDLWFPNEKPLNTIDRIELKLNKIRSLKSLQQAEYRVDRKRNSTSVYPIFDTDLFEPLKFAAPVISNELLFDEHSKWFICIDEIEILDEKHHRILNSYMRTNNDNFYFKFTTLPYAHHTLQTNVNVPLDYRHDFQYIYIDQDVNFQQRATGANNFIERLFLSRARLSKPDLFKIGLNKLFGESKLLKPIFEYSLSDLIPEKNDIEPDIDEKSFYKLLRYYSNLVTIERAYKLSVEDKSALESQIVRKMKNLIYLKHQLLYSRKGKRNITLYSGFKLISLVGDANPRKLLKIFDEMIKKYESRGGENSKSENSEEPMISYADQNMVLAMLAEQELSTNKNQESIGNALYHLIFELGKSMKNYIHNQELTTEQVSSVEINSSLNEFNWSVVRRAVQRGLLYPNININNPNMVPVNEGVFHLAYIFCPINYILPRKGDSRSINRFLQTIQLQIDFNA